MPLRVSCVALCSPFDPLLIDEWRMRGRNDANAWSCVVSCFFPHSYHPFGHVRRRPAVNPRVSLLSLLVPHDDYTTLAFSHLLTQDHPICSFLPDHRVKPHSFSKVRVWRGSRVTLWGTTTREETEIVIFVSLFCAVIRLSSGVCVSEFSGTRDESFSSSSLSADGGCDRLPFV